MSATRFWEHKSLAQMTDSEWESLCDGCARCCLHKLEDADSGEVFYTGIRCRYLHENSCRCSDYPRRSELVPHCIDLRRENLDALHWLPASCAYRRLHEGKPLLNWHPLISGSTETVHEAGVSIRGRALSDEFVHPDGYDEHVVHWVEQ
ncbi:MAG: YcgN family cysteine cluster protein [Pseudomonadota bacterium]